MTYARAAMRIEGSLTKWNDDRGFGFITPRDGGPEVFVHISTFPRDGIRPQVGESLSFEIGAGNDGKKRAVHIARPGARKASTPRPRTPPRRAAPRSAFGTLVKATLVIALAAVAYQQFAPRFTRLSAAVTSTEQANTAKQVPAATNAFRCDGRTHCSQMTSCEEAKYFLRNCPGVQMDGNNDGVPCEQQWCTSGW